MLLFLCQDCFVGVGEDYRGEVGAPHDCAPWDLLPLHEPLSPLVFPESLGGAAPGTPVCRNPMSLAKRPFCLVPQASGGRQPVECLRLPQCVSAGQPSIKPESNVSLFF